MFRLTSRRAFTLHARQPHRNVISYSDARKQAYSKAEHSEAEAKSETNDGPLKGVRVLDFSRILAGPFCSQILADYGAEVVKVESLQGDETRSWQGKGEADDWEENTGPMSFYFASVNRNKKSITLDLKQPEALEVAYRLAKTSDVVLENFVPGSADRLGIGYKKLSEINPRLVYASISGYGASGPYSKRAGYDAIAAAEGGLMHVTGHPDGPPVRPGLGMTDMATGLYTHGAIVSALYSRDRTGKGQHISSSLFETQISLLINIGANWLNRGVEGQRYGAAHPSIVPYNTWRCKDGQWLAVAANNAAAFQFAMAAFGTEPAASRISRFTAGAAGAGEWTLTHTTRGRAANYARMPSACVRRASGSASLVPSSTTATSGGTRAFCAAIAAILVSGRLSSAFRSAATCRAWRPRATWPSAEWNVPPEKAALVRTTPRTSSGTPRGSRWTVWSTPRSCGIESKPAAWMIRAPVRSACSW